MIASQFALIQLQLGFSPADLQPRFLGDREWETAEVCHDFLSLSNTHGCATQGSLRTF